MKERLLVSVTNGNYLKKKKAWVLVKLDLHGNKYKTKYVNGGENVVFQKETFIFEVNEDVYPAGTLEIKVKTWEMLSSGETFCVASLPLSPITNEIRQLKEQQQIDTQQPIYLDKIINLKNKDGSNTITNSTITLNFELVPENDSNTMKSLPLMFRWFPELPHNEQVLSECYCTKQAKKMVGMSHSGTMYITGNYIAFRSPSHLAKNKKTLISFKEIKSIKKKIGTFYLPNAIQIRTRNKKKYLFSSFIHRSKAFKVLSSQWVLNGGGINNGNESSDDEDDSNEDDDDDETTTNNYSDDDSGDSTSPPQQTDTDQDDDELVSINSGNGTAINGLIRNLSPLPKLTTSNSSNGSGNGGGKKRSLSISNNSPSRGTPTLLPDNSNNSSTNTNGISTTSITSIVQNIKVSIEIEDFELLGSSNIVTIQIAKDSLVKDLLEKLKTRLFTTTSTIDKSQYILCTIKPKKSSKRNSKRLNKSQLIEQQPIDSTTILKNLKEKNNNQLIISTPSITLSHRQITPSPSSTANGNNKHGHQQLSISTGGMVTDRKFYILENDKTVSSYFKHGQSIETLYFKKNSIVTDIHLTFELVEDKSKCIKLNLSTHSKVIEIYRELSAYTGSGKRLTMEDHYFYIPKNGERGIILHPYKSLNNYNISGNTVIQVLHYPPWKSFCEKFKYFDKNDKHLLFELVQCCFSNSLPNMRPVDMENPQQFLDKLQQKLMIDDTEARQITKNLLYNSSYKDEGILVELKSRMESLLLDSNPYYNEFSFGTGNDDDDGNYSTDQLSQSNYEKWKSIEISSISRVMKSIIFKEDDFIGCVFINILQGQDLKFGSGDDINCFIILSNGEKMVKTTTIKNESNPIWSESFLLKIKKPRTRLELLVMNYNSDSCIDECIGIIEISIKDDTSSGIVTEGWYNIKSVNGGNGSSGQINLSIEYEYQFQEFNEYLIQLPNRQLALKEYKDLDGTGSDGNSEPINNPNSLQNLTHKNSVLHVSLYSTLFNFILEQQESLKISIMISPSIGKRYGAGSGNNNKPFINPFDDTTNDDKEDDVWILSYYRILLNQYSIRYGLSKSTTDVIQLSIMSSRYSIEMKPSLASSTTALSNKSKNYIIELQDTLDSIHSTITTQPWIFIKSELISIQHSISELYDQVKYTIGRYYESFPNNKPRDALKSLVCCLSLICKLLNLNISSTSDQEHVQINFNQLLSTTIMIEQKNKFEENINAMGLFQMELPQKLKMVSEISSMLIQLIDIIQEEVENTLRYESAFPIEVKITCDLIDVWGSCILGLIEDFCNWAPYHANILVLVKRVLDYHNFTKSIAMERFKPMPLKQLFVTYVYKLLKEIKLSLSTIVIDSIKRDDKKTLASITLGHSWSFKLFFESVDQKLKDFDSLQWLPDSFSFVQLLEVVSSEIIHYVTVMKLEITEFINHTIIDTSPNSDGSKPYSFQLNIEPLIMYNNIEQCSAKLDSIANTIQSNLSANQKERKKQGEHEKVDKNTVACIDDSFKLCLKDTHSFIQSSIINVEDMFITLIKNYLFYSFSSILFSEPLVLKNSHYTEPIINIDDQQIGQLNSSINSNSNGNGGNGYESPISLSTSTNSNNGGNGNGNSLVHSHLMVPIQNSQSSSSESLNSSFNNNNGGGVTPSNVVNSYSLRRFEKLILSQIKEFLTPKIEELYGKFRETSFKPFLKKLWCEIIQELQYLLISRPKESRQPFHFNNVILNFDQITIVNNVLKEMVVLFHRGGAGGGIATPILEEKLIPLRTLLILSENDTTSLIDQYNQNLKKFNGTGSNGGNNGNNGNGNNNNSNIISILSTRIEFDKEARTFVNKINGVIEKPLVVDGIDINIENIVVLPESELIIDKATCTYNGQLGLLIISSRYLGFQNLLRQVGVQIGNKLSVPLLKIVEVKKTKVAFIFNAIQIKTSENKLYNFSGFLDRDLVYNDLIHQIQVIKKNTTKQQQKVNK